MLTKTIKDGQLRLVFSSKTCSDTVVRLSSVQWDELCRFVKGGGEVPERGIACSGNVHDVAGVSNEKYYCTGCKRECGIFYREYGKASDCCDAPITHEIEYDDCKNCSGNGFILGNGPGGLSPCPDCGADGEVPVSHKEGEHRD